MQTEKKDIPRESVISLHKCPLRIRDAPLIINWLNIL